MNNRKLRYIESTPRQVHGIAEDEEDEELHKRPSANCVFYTFAQLEAIENGGFSAAPQSVQEYVSQLILKIYDLLFGVQGVAYKKPKGISVTLTGTADDGYSIASTQLLDQAPDHAFSQDLETGTLTLHGGKGPDYYNSSIMVAMQNLRAGESSPANKRGARP